MTVPAQRMAYEHNGAAVSRERFYEVACDPRRSVAVEACAGAGKTWMLVSRIVRALLAGAQPHEVLAITFTKKAAGEMRKRLQDWLSQFAGATPQVLRDKLIERGVAHPTDEDIAALRGLHARLLASGRPVQVRTFHSWFAALLRNAPLAVLEELRLPADYELLEDDKEAIELLWRRFYTAVSRDSDARADYEAAVAAHGRTQTRRAIEAVLDRRVEFAFADGQGVVEASVERFDAQFPEFTGLARPSDALASIPAIREPLLAAARALGRGARTFAEKGVQLEQAVAGANLDAAIDALLTQKRERRVFSEKLEGIADVRAAQEIVERLCAAGAQHDAWLHQQRMTRLARIAIDEFAALKRERGWADMNDVERSAMVMLEDPVLSGWVQERLDARTRHLLIDEFQDTNPLQWQALHAWLSAYAGAGSGAPSIFIVGDPKQSIYRFRRAEPALFRAAQAFIADAFDGDRLSCDHTHRNAPAVMDAVNRVMTAAQDAVEYEGFREHTTESQAAGGVWRLPRITRDAVVQAQADAQPGWRDSLTVPRELPEERLAALECRQAAAWVAAAIASGRKPEDIMVIARRRERLSTMEEELRAIHVPAQQPEKSDLRDAPEVQDVVALLDALVSPSHDLSLARALKSPLSGFGDGELVDVAAAVRAARDAGAPLSWFECLQQDTAQGRLREAGVQLARWKKLVDRLPPHDALAAVFAEADVLARFGAMAPPPMRPLVLARLRALLGAALAWNGGRYATPYAFVRALKAGGMRAPAASAHGAVNLVTVHGAKGLEAPVVLLLDTDPEAPRAESMGVLLDWPRHAPAPTRFAFVASEKQPPPCTADAVEAERGNRRREELNLLYVAMTRAKEMLVISSLEPHRANEGSWWQRIEAHAQPLEAAPPHAGSQAQAHETFALRQVPALPAREPIAVAAPQDDLDSRVGQAMHRLLELSPGNVVHSDAHLARVAREFALDLQQAQRAAQMAQRIASGEGAWAWDAAVVDWQANEVPLHHGGELMRIDRLVRRGGEWWVLDYKSAAAPQQQGELLAQMQRYRAALEAIHPGEPVRAAFLTAQGRLVLVA